MTKAKSIVSFILCLLFHLHLYGQAAIQNQILPLKLKSSYSKGETIKFCISNESGVDVYVEHIALKVYDSIQNEWIEQVQDMLNKECNEFAGINGFLLQAGSSQEIIWNPKKVNAKRCFNYKTNQGLFYITYKWSADIEKKTFTEVKTATFTIN